MKYKAKPGSPINDAQAQAIGETAEEIIRDGHPITPATLVDRARNPKSPIHDMFDWNDKNAAENWRKKQARGFLSAVCVIEIKTKEPVRAFYSIDLSTTEEHPDPSRLYKTRKEIMVSDSDRHQLCYDLYKKVRHFCDEAESLGLASEFSEWNRIIQVVKASEMFEVPKLIAK